MWFRDRTLVNLTGFPVVNVLVVACLAIGVCSTTVGADDDVPTAGDDGQDGRSPSRAFATIQRGVDALKPGDRLTVAPGEYFGSVRRVGLGGPDADTVIRAELGFNGRGIGSNSLSEFSGDNTLEHCEFAGFTHAAIDREHSTHTFLTGNRFDNPRSPAVRTDTLTTILYSDYNAYSAADTIWKRDDRSWSLPGTPYLPGFQRALQRVRPRF